MLDLEVCVDEFCFVAEEERKLTKILRFVLLVYHDSSTVGVYKPHW
jgi:hypothetical protein